MVYGVYGTHRDGSSFTWHQPCNNGSSVASSFGGYSERAVWNYSTVWSRVRLEPSRSAQEIIMITMKYFRYIYIYIYIYIEREREREIERDR